MGKKRPGSDAAIELLESNSVEDWTEAFSRYDECIRRLSQEKGRAELVQLDRWWREELPTAIRSRGDNPHITKEELVKVVKWKLRVGAFRPSLERFASETNPAQVRKKSGEALALLPSPAKGKNKKSSGSSSSSNSSSSNSSIVSSEVTAAAVRALEKDLKGVGPATASAVLAAACGGCPFDADEVIDAVKKTGERKYSLPEYLEVWEALTKKASQLGSPWDAERVRKSLWARAMCSRFALPIGGKAKGGGNRSRIDGGEASGSKESRGAGGKVKGTADDDDNERGGGSAGRNRKRLKSTR